MAKQEVTAPNSSALPAYLQGQTKQNKIGNIDSSDKIMPRIKLMQSVSPELDAFENAKKGEFWHNVASISLGNKLRGIPIIMRKTYVLWAPRGDDRGILARANDGLHWDLPGAEFTVKPKNSPHNVTYKLGQTVNERVGGQVALSEFGSSIPGDAKSPPAAALTYQFLWFFPEFASFSPAVIINTRSSVKPGKDLLSKIDLRPVDHFFQAYEIGVTKQKNGTGDEFFNYTYASAGYATEDEGALTKQLFETFQSTEWRANDENEDTDGDGLDEPAGGKPKGNGKPLDKDTPF